MYVHGSGQGAELQAKVSLNVSADPARRGEGESIFP